MRTDLHPTLAYKIVTLDTLLARIAHWRKVGNSIVFTNGCFDIIHAGHISLLAQCRDYGDYLVLGLNSDGSVKRLKGDTRPINQQEDRAMVLAAIEFVDAVVAFDEDTPHLLITAIKPDVLVKGGDYQLENVVGAEMVQGYGGQVKIVPLLPGYSTTNLLSR